MDSGRQVRQHVDKVMCLNEGRESVDYMRIVMPFNISLESLH